MAANPKDPPRRHFTIEEYFALENVGDARYEYWDGDIVCMSGGTEAHSRVLGNVYHELRLRLDTNGRCTPFTTETAVKTPGLPPYRYPDVSVACAEGEFEKIGGNEVLVNPVLIVEVLSPSTEEHDYGEKFGAYKSIPGFAEYVLLEQDRPRAIQFRRQADGFWVRQPEILGLSGEIALPSIDCALPLAAVYRRVRLKTN